VDVSKTRPPSISDALLPLLFNGLFFKTTWISQYQKGRTILDFTEARNDKMPMLTETILEY